MASIRTLENNVRTRKVGYGSYEITIGYHGKTYSCISHNSLAYDRIGDRGYIPDRAVRESYTYKEALTAFYDECKRINRLGEYNDIYTIIRKSN